MTTVSRPAAEMIGVSKRFKEHHAVRSISLTAEEGTFFSILGPSGCGKTTTLRMLAGFVQPDEGEIRLGGEEVSRVPPHRRDVNTVFQSYALFGHLSVAGNVAFGLKRRKVPAAEVRQRVAQMLEVVSLADRMDARPSELSGGQQQRVALARALVNMPRLLLLDEPLGALDLKLRRQMQTELKHIQREVGVAFIYVTHDQEEALTMSDRIAVMNEGRILQTGTPAQIYEHPANLFVAQFIGSTNSLPGRYADGTAGLDCGVTVPVGAAEAAGLSTGDALVACVRPERVLLSRPDQAARAAPTVPAGPRGALAGTIIEATYLGSSISYRVRVGPEETIGALVPSGSGEGSLPVGSEVEIGWRPADCMLFRQDTGAAISSTVEVEQWI
jgi:spermidine/putrescine transport system ATP-binding protein